MKVEIETYRGFEISFDSDTEEFYGISDRHDKDISKKSFSATKKFIDDFIKENQEFKPFNVEPNPNAYGGKKGRIIGIRKDKRFIIELANGKKEQISDYQEKDFIMVNSDNKMLWLELEKISKERELLTDKEKEVKSKIKAKTLRDYKNELEL
jgi:hypothetical protein